MSSNLQDRINHLKTDPNVRKLVDRMPRSMKVGLRRVIDRADSGDDERNRLVQELGSLNTMVAHLIYESARNAPRSLEPKRLLSHGFKVYSSTTRMASLKNLQRIGTTISSSSNSARETGWKRNLVLPS